MRSAPPSRRIAALEAEIEQLQAEIKALKRELAGRPAVTKNPEIVAPRLGPVDGVVSRGGAISVTGRKRGRPPKGEALSGADRLRRFRAKRKAAR